MAARTLVGDDPRGQHFVTAWIHDAGKDLLAFGFGHERIAYWALGGGHGGICWRESLAGNLILPAHAIYGKSFVKESQNRDTYAAVP